VFGQQNNSSNNPSVSKPFGNSSTTASVFGATQTLSPFSSNTTSSASSSPAFNSSMPASGASSTPAFGNSSLPFGGSLFYGILVFFIY
jgi:nuclear pore complex protein Nup98-Nup96